MRQKAATQPVATSSGPSTKAFSQLAPMNIVWQVLIVVAIAAPIFGLAYLFNAMHRDGEPTYCDGCKRFSRGVGCPRCD